MPRKPRPWFRFYVEAMRDPKMRRLTPAQRWLWVAILAAARESCEPGRLLIAAGVPMTESDLADYAGMRRPEIMDGLALMVTLGMVTDDDGTWTVPAWDDRQYESDNTTERTRKHRSNEQGRNVPTSAVGTHQNTETETEPVEKRRKRRPPVDYQPTDKQRLAAVAKGLDPDEQCQAWLTWCDANGRTYDNVTAGFSTWINQAKPAIPMRTNGFAKPERQRCRVCADMGSIVVDGEVRECGCRSRTFS